MFRKLSKTQTAPKKPRICYMALSDGLRISSSRTIGQNVCLFESRFGMSATQATLLAQTIQSTFEASSS
jgi:hypothetical protein